MSNAMSKMNVVAFKSTGHVLGTVTRSTQAGVALAVEHVAAGGMLLRDSDNARLQALIGRDHLKLVLADYDSRVLYRPQLFAVSDDSQVVQQGDAAALTVVMDGAAVTVNLPAVTPSDIEVFVHVSGGALAEAAVVPVRIAKTTSSASASLVLGVGSYTVALFAPGYATRLLLETVP